MEIFSSSNVIIVSSDSAAYAHCVQIVCRLRTGFLAERHERRWEPMLLRDARSRCLAVQHM